LKVLAKTPVIPAISIKSEEKASSTGSRSILWAGANLQVPVGDELSAFGAAFADGGVSISQLDENSVLKKFGLKTGDLIQKINAAKIKNITELKAYLEANKKVVSHIFFILRNQQIIEIRVNLILPVI